MKNLLTLLLAALAFAATAQPQKIHYQGVAVGANGKPIKNSTVGLRLSVLDSLPTGSTLYTETQTASTDASGQFSIYLGGGTATAGTFANLPWANGNDKFLKVEMDAQGGSNYQPMGTTQLVSVPYAMAAGSLREGALLYGNNGQKYQLTIDSMGPKWIVAPFVCGQTVTYAGESYPTVQIGTQCWFAKNLHIGTMINGTSDQTNNSLVEKYCYNNDSTNCSIYGGLYQWAEAVQYQNGASNTSAPNPLFSGKIKGICPSGWHIPSYAEWDTTVNLYGGQFGAGLDLQSVSFGGTNSSGLNVFPTGYRYNDRLFYDLLSTAGFWTTWNNSGPNGAMVKSITRFSSTIGTSTQNKILGYSIRCLKD